MAKNPVYVESGRLGARRRWGTHAPKIVRLTDLTEAQRRLVVALIEAAKAEPSDEPRAA
jgi:hypothetical protein